MARLREDVTAAELAVLESLWADEPATIRAITDQLYPEGRPSEYATVQKLLERLERKGYVRRMRRSVPHRFRTRVDRAELIAFRLQDVADTLCAGSVTPLLTQLVEGGGLSNEDIETLRTLVRSLESEREDPS